MASITFREVEGSSPKFWMLFGALGLFVLFGALAWNTMHHYGHVVTGMDNQIVWGLPTDGKALGGESLPEDAFATN